MQESKVIKLKPGESVTIVCDAEDNAPVQTTTTSPNSGGETDTDGRLMFGEMLAKFNEVLAWRGYKAVCEGMAVYDYLFWAFHFAERLYDADDWMFRAESYPLLYDYRGKDETDIDTGYNAMQSWLMASALAELVPDSGATTNTQTELFKLAYEIGGGKSYPLYNGKALKADPYAMREAASVMYAICRGDNNIDRQIETYRSEFGGHIIPASSWDGLGFKDHQTSDAQGRTGYVMDYLGYCVNTQMFFPSAPGPRVDGTVVCLQPWPWAEGQPDTLFNIATGNYVMDEYINSYFVREYNMMSQTPLSVWQSYSREKQNRMVNVGAIPPCTYMYMFGRKGVKFDGIMHRSYGDNPAYDYYCFSETDEDTGIALDGPFSDLSSLYRYDVTEKNESERFIETVTGIADNFRFPTQDPNYGRCRPGCRVSRTVEELNPIHGAAENEIYNIDLCALVADTAAQKAKILSEDGFAADSPRSYVSGHSAQIWALALSFIQMNNEGNCEQWVRKAFEYSVNRSVGRFHWNSDCVYGRLFGAMTLPIVNAMTGVSSDYESTKSYVRNQPVGNPVISFSITITNNKSSAITLDGDIAFVLGNPDHNGTYLGWLGQYNTTSHIRFAPGAVTIGAGQSATYSGVSWVDADSGCGMGEKSPLDPSKLYLADRPRNVLLYVNGISDTILANNMDTSIIFEDGQTYAIVIPA